MYGTQAKYIHAGTLPWFENDVKMYGTQAEAVKETLNRMFENDVKMYGTQAYPTLYTASSCLRMM